MGSMANNEPGKEMFDALITIIRNQAQLLAEIADKINKIEFGGGSGNGFQVYESNKLYKRYQAVIDPNTDTAYLVVPKNEGTEYTSVTVQQDCEDGNLKLLGYDSHIVAFDHRPSTEEISVLPEQITVVEYSTSDTPYVGILNTPEHEVGE